MKSAAIALGLLTMLAAAPSADAQVYGYYGPRGRVIVQSYGAPNVVVSPGLRRGQARRYARWGGYSPYYNAGPRYAVPNYSPGLGSGYAYNHTYGYHGNPNVVTHPGYYSRDRRFYGSRDDRREAWEDYQDDLEDRREDYEEWVEDRIEDERERAEDLREEREERIEDYQEYREELRERQREAWEKWRERYDD